jgi:multicomponent Na+:H+ antiporter subunit A
LSLLHLAILAPFFMAILVPIVFKGLKKMHTGWFVLLLPIVLFIYFLTYLPITTNHQSVQKTLEWIPSLGINFTAYLDGLGLIFSLLITGIGALVILYSIYYLDKKKEQLHNFYVYLLLFMGGMLGIVLSDNMIVLYTFWEVTSFSSFLLIGYWYYKQASREGAQKSMLITVLGGLAMLGSFILMYIMTGTFSIRETISVSDQLIQNPLFFSAMILILIGAFTKSAQFPFYIWLPDAMEAPTPVSAYLHSATMVKAGIYLIARFTPIFSESASWVWIIGLIGLITMCWAAFNALKQNDLKGILAYSTVSQLGLIISLLGVGAASIHYEGVRDDLYPVAIFAALFHLLNHATFKGSLFMVAGIIDHETGTRDIRKLGGLMSLMPVTFTVALVGTFSMAGIPPFNGFLSKEMFFSGMVSVLDFDFFRLGTWGVLFPVLAWLGSIFTFIYSILLFFKTFTGKFQLEKLDRKPHEAPIGMLISPVILGVLVVVFGLFPNILSYSIIEPAAYSILPSLLQPGEKFEIHIALWHGLTIEVWMTVGVIAIGIILYMLFPKWNWIYSKLPRRVTLNYFFNSLLSYGEKGAHFTNKWYMTGFIRTYLVYIFVFFVGIVGFTLWIKDGFKMDTNNLAPIGVYEVVLASVILLASFMVLFAKSRLTSIISLGAVGYTVSLFFVLFRAPDLALTQLVIETISVALFLLCFYHLPPLNKHESRIRFRLNNAVIAISVGVIITLVSIASHSTKLFNSISSYYVKNVYKEAGGENMVNVILVDFRGFDTLFEISVLAIAALGIFGLIKLRLTRGKIDENE